MMLRLWIYLLLVTLSGTALGARASSLPDAEWQRYKASFVSPEGRIIDTGNGGVSHSEGQGYGMLLALAAEDRATFEAIWAWTRENLRRDDGLFAWQWRPGQEPPVKDWNNATDGDLLIAWALARGGERWTQAEWTEAARAIAIRLRETVVRPSGIGPMLLPGQQGFERGDHLLLNPAYWVYPAFEVLGQIDADPVWTSLTQSGMNLLALTRYGPAGVPPDWVQLHAEGRLALPNDPARRRIAFEAIRVPLYLCWAKLKDPVLMQGFLLAWPDERAPAWIDLVNGDRAAYPLTLAQQVIRQLVLGCSGKLQDKPTILIESGDYYGSTLSLLTYLVLTQATNLP